HALAVARRPLQPHPQPGPRPQVVIQLGFRSVLRHRQIHPPVPVIITQRRPALFPIHLDPAHLPGHRLEVPSTIPFQPQPPPGSAPPTARNPRPGPSTPIASSYLPSITSTVPRPPRSP